MDHRGDVLVTVGRIPPGSPFGELALLSGKTRSSTVVAEEPLELLWLTKEDFFSLQLDRLFVSDLQDRIHALQRSGEWTPRSFFDFRPSTVLTRII